MAIPNTTPTPNELYNGEMNKMSDTELRVVLIVTRATLGWVIDKTTGKRKEEDWISYYQLKKKTGRASAALAKAINNCVIRKWIEARDRQGNILDTKNKRIGKKVFYRLGTVFLDRIVTSSESEEVNGNIHPTSSESEISESEEQQKKYITKERIQLPTVIGKPNGFGHPDVNNLISFLKEKLELPMLDGSDKQNRKYCWIVMKKFGGADKVRLLIEAAARDKFWATKITSFQQLYYKGVQIISNTREGANNAAIDASQS